MEIKFLYKYTIKQTTLYCFKIALRLMSFTTGERQNISKSRIWKRVRNNDLGDERIKNIERKKRAPQIYECLFGV